jgi:hypothetical protein
MNKLLTAIISLAFIAGCNAPKSEQTASENEAVEESPKVTFTKAPASPAYENASLSLDALDISMDDSVASGMFSFQVENYELGVQTEGSDTRGIANSGKGQHIHLIIDNGPYSAHYETSFEKEMEPGRHVVLAFLSRSYHESVKNATSYYIDVVDVGDVSDAEEIDLSAPHLFYSRPKGTYAGADTEKLMIDFFLLNTSISPDGNKVRATVNGNEYIIDEWAPYYVEGLPKGEITVKLELIDAEGNVIPGPFNSVERKVQLTD